MKLNLNPSIQAAAQQKDRFLHEPWHVHDHGTRVGLPAELEQPRVQFRAAPRAGLGLHEEFPMHRRQFLVEQREFQMADHRRENVVEIMRDAAGQRADHLPFL